MAEHNELGGRSGQPTEQASRFYQCRICRKSFAKSEHLVRHIRSHTKEKPFVCPDCGTGYSRRDILVRHRRDVRCKQRGRRNSTSVVGDFIAIPYEPSNDNAAIDPDAGAIQAAAVLGISTPRNFLPTSTNDADVDASPSTARDTSLAGSTMASTLTMDSVQQFPDMVDIGRQDCGAFFWDFPAWSEQNISQIFDPGSDKYPFGAGDFMNVDVDPVWMMPESNSPASAPAPDPEMVHLGNIQRTWYNNVAATTLDHLYPTTAGTAHSLSGTLTPADSDEIDEHGRQALKRRLHIPFSEPAIPSVDQIRMLVRLFFTKAAPIIPMIHAPTFRPSRSNRILVIAMCALGSLFTGATGALRQAIQFYEMLEKSSMAKWELLVRQDQDSFRIMVQCATICEALGLLAGSPALLVTTDSFHGTPVAWARLINLHRGQPPFHLDRNITGEDLEAAWRAWAQREEMIRLVEGLFIIDAELSIMFHHEPCQNYGSYSLNYSSSERVWTASTAEEWKQEFFKETPSVVTPSNPRTAGQLAAPVTALRNLPPTSALGAHALLKAITLQARWQKPWQFPDDNEFAETFHATMAECYRKVILNDDQRQSPSPLQVEALWHSVYVMYYVDLDLLETAVGRDGYKIGDEEHARLVAWAQSDEARMCILHGIILSKYVQKTTFSQNVAPHIPHSLFVAGLSLICYMRYGCSTTRAAGRSKLANLPAKFPQITLLLGQEGGGGGGTAAETDVLLELLFSTTTANEPEKRGRREYQMLRTLFCDITDVLRCARHWNVAERFVSTLNTIIDFELGQ